MSRPRPFPSTIHTGAVVASVLLANEPSHAQQRELAAPVVTVLVGGFGTAFMVLPVLAFANPNQGSVRGHLGGGVSDPSTRLNIDASASGYKLSDGRWGYEGRSRMDFERQDEGSHARLDAMAALALVRTSDNVLRFEALMGSTFGIFPIRTDGIDTRPALAGTLGLRIDVATAPGLAVDAEAMVTPWLDLTDGTKRPELQLSHGARFYPWHSSLRNGVGFGLTVRRIIPIDEGRTNTAVFLSVVAEGDDRAIE
jgi:hypothetical protein